MPDVVVDAQRFDFIKGGLDDCRRLIAAAKTQRWEALKWAVALNVALAGAAGIKDSPVSATWVLATSSSVAAIGMALIVHFNRRARDARRDAARFEEELGAAVVPDFVLEHDRRVASKQSWYDASELTTFGITLLGSACVSIFAHPQARAVSLRIMQQAGSFMSLTAAGLCLNMVGVMLVFFFGFPQPSHEEGMGMELEDETPLPGGETVAQHNFWVRWRRKGYVGASHAGLAMMFVGFLLQFIDTFK